MERADDDDKQVYTTALQWLEQDSTPRMIVSVDLRLRWANQAADEFLRIDKGISLRDDFLVLADQSHQRKLSEFVASLTDRMSTLALDNAGGHLLFRGWAFDSDQLGCLCFLRDDSDFSPEYSDVATVFGLTSAENGVLGYILRGWTVAEIAEMRGIAPGTVRTHVRRIYAKIEVSSRESLLFRLSAYRVL